MAAGEEITSWQDRATYDRYPRGATVPGPEVLDMLEQHARGEPLSPSPSSMWGWGVEEISELMRASADN